MRLKQFLMVRVNIIALLALAAVFFGLPVAAADFSKGFEAYKRGDYATAFAEWAPLAGAGNAGVQYNIGVLYHRGQGVSQDYGEALKWYGLAAEQGYARAQYNIGLLYAKGEGVTKDATAGAVWFERAAANGYKGCRRAFAVARHPDTG